MKEFCSQTGGRQTYVDDIVNLQDLALAITSIFDGCDNFVISGCGRSGQTIAPGYVYINGKVRVFQGAAGITTFPQYIYEHNVQESVSYASGTDKVGRNNYGCSIDSSAPTSLDALTGAVPQFIQYNSTGVKGLKEAFLARFAVLLSSPTEQKITGDVALSGKFKVTGDITSSASVGVSSNGKTSRIYCNSDGDIAFESVVDGNKQAIVFTKDSIVMSCSGEVVTTYSKNSVNHHVPVSASQFNGGAITIVGGNIYNSTDSANDGAVNINMIGHLGALNTFRDTVIGDGKGVEVFRVNGSKKTAAVYGELCVNNSNAVGIRLQSSLLKDNVNLTKVVRWEDADGVSMANVGFVSNSNQLFSIDNLISNVAITGVSYVNLGPEIREDGIALSKKYLTVDAFDKYAKGAALTEDVYTSTQADEQFAKLANGLSQFLSDDKNKSELRSEIDAVSMKEVSDKHPTLDKLLSDMATSEAAAKKICENIGAASKDEVQLKLKDTGWIDMENGFKARQIGNIVSIQGAVSPTTIMTGERLFTLPNNIDGPTHPVEFHHALGRNVVWSSTFANGQKWAHVMWKDSSYVIRTINYSLTYMV